VLEILQTAELPIAGYQAIAAVDVLEPGAHVPRHRHPGTILAIVAAGEVTVEQDRQPSTGFAAGESFVIPVDRVHAIYNDGSRTARLYVTFIVRKGEPLTLRP
jgi:quercetin dioxygenase-like cupin family protein